MSMSCIRFIYSPCYDAMCRQFSYNHLVDYAKDLVKGLARICDEKNPEGKVVEIPGFSGTWWMVYDETRGNHQYWIAISNKGLLVDGQNKIGVFKNADRSISLEYLTSHEEELDKHDHYYSPNDGRLDYATLIMLSCSLLKLSEELGYSKFYKTMRQRLDKLPVDVSKVLV